MMNNSGVTSATTCPQCRKNKIRLPKLCQQCSSATVGTQTVNTELVDVTDVLRYMKDMIAGSDKPDQDAIQKCLNATYMYRRNYILMECPKVIVVKDIFPGLFNLKSVIEEFKLIKKLSIYDNFMNSIECHRDILIQSAQDYEEVDFVKDRMCYYATDAEHLEYVKSAGALLVLPSFFKHKGKVLKFKEILEFDNEEKDSKRGYISCSVRYKACLDKDARFIIYAENVEICETTDLRVAFFALIAVYYIFSMIYPNRLKEMMTILEKFFLKVQPEETQPTVAVQKMEALLAP